MDRKVICLRSTDAPNFLKDHIQAAGWQVEVTNRIEAARALIDEQHHCVGLVEFTREHLNGRAHKLEQLLRCTPGTGWIGLADGDLLPALLKHNLIPGFLYDYHTYPLDPMRLVHSLGHAYRMVRANRYPYSPPGQPVVSHGIVGVSSKMEKVIRDIRKVARVDAPIMLSGETGTGKELAAHAIHRESERRNGPFLAINCGAIAADLIQSALFGHEKGAFTGAHRRQIGYIEAAHGGTIFLDEIGDLSLDLQVNLLRFLQESTITRLGSAETILVNVRVIAASHIDLFKAVKNGQFREDLYYRLNVLELHLPPLRERQDDIEVLAHHFFSVFAKERNSNVRGFSPDALEAMRIHHWPGNVRELINRVRRATIMCEHSLITPVELDLDVPESVLTVRTLAAARAEAEMRAIESSLHSYGNNVSQAARQLGVTRVTLYRLLRKYRSIGSESDDKSRRWLAPLAIRGPDPP